MLAVQRFMREHEDWETILTSAPYNLMVKRKGSLILLKYNQISSDFSEPIVREARGLIVEDGTYDLVCLPFFKFFNIGEKYADKIDWSTATATEKIDGSIMKVYFYDGQWRIATNGNIDARDAELSDVMYHNFYDLFMAAAVNSGLDFDRLDVHYTYVFELVSPHNTVVIRYPQPALYHLMSRDMRTLAEEDIDIGVQKPRTYLLSSEQEYTDFVASMNEDGSVHEGIVVRDALGRRVKIKTETYFTMHHMANNGKISPEYVFDLIQSNDYEEFLAYFPAYTEYVEEMIAKYHEMIRILQIVQHCTGRIKAELQAIYSEQVAKRVFAGLVSDSPYKSFYFDAWKGVDWTQKITQVTSAERRDFNRIISIFFN